MSTQIEAMFAESGLEQDDDLAGLLAPLADLAATPEPTSQLADAFLTVRVLGQRASRRARIARSAAGAAMAAAVSVTATGLAAAANTLPAPLQHRVSDFSERYLPFRFPEPTYDVVPAPPTRGKQVAPDTPADAGGGLDETGPPAVAERAPTPTGRPTRSAATPDTSSPFLDTAISRPRTTAGNSQDDSDETADPTSETPPGSSGTTPTAAPTPTALAAEAKPGGGKGEAPGKAAGTTPAKGGGGGKEDDAKADEAAAEEAKVRGVKGGEKDLGMLPLEGTDLSTLPLLPVEPADTNPVVPTLPMLPDEAPGTSD